MWVCFGESPVAEVSITLTEGRFSFRIRLNGPVDEHVLVYAAAPVRSGVRYVTHFPFLCLLPPPTDGWSDLTDLYVDRYGVPKPNWAVWVRTCQHRDGWQDVPKTVRVRLGA
jgi:hypothetical protein